MASRRADSITSFMVMDLLERAKLLEAKGLEVVHLEIGEPDMDTPLCIKEAAIRAIKQGKTHYTHSLGIHALREAICEHYLEEYGVHIHPDQILVTSGTSPALFMIFSVLLDPKDQVIVPEPYYPCYPNFVLFVDGVPVTIPSDPQAGFRPDPADLKRNLGPNTKAIIINSPSNPTGQVLEPEILREIAGLGPMIISDEIYHGISYGQRCHSILEYTDEAFVLNGFSKRYAMTGWRLGYIIAPKRFIRPLQKLQQNILISANSISQHAAVAALREAGEDVRSMVRTYQERRELILEGLKNLGFQIGSEPKGAFYVFADASHIYPDSLKLSQVLLDEALVAVTPGVEFGRSVRSFLRFSYANSLQEIEKGLLRISQFLKRCRGSSFF